MASDSTVFPPNLKLATSGVWLPVVSRVMESIFGILVVMVTVIFVPPSSRCGRVLISIA